MLELLDAAAERRCRHVQCLGRTGVAQGISDREEVAKVAKLHYPIIC
jgi:hypothetical protein